MKKTMTRILLLAAALVLALGLTAVYAEGEEAAVSTTAYIFWQDQDWWPAAGSAADDYWTPTPAVVTGEGWYTVKVDAHMPSWFYSGGNSNIGAQKLAVIIADGNDLFPGMYMQITNVIIDGVAYPCGDVTYGQTGYENAAEDGTLFWDANDSYALLYDQWMIDNEGSIGNGGTWNSAAQAQNFAAFDVSVLHNPQSIEIEFFLSYTQDEKPEGGSALRVLGEGPKLHGQVVALSDLSATPDNAATARLHYLAANQWVKTDNVNVATEEITIKGEGEYTATAYLIDQGGWTHSHNTDGTNKLYLVVDSPAGTTMDGMKVGVSAIRVDGKEIAFGNAGYGQTYYDDTWHNFFGKDDYYLVLYDQYQKDNGGSVSSMGLSTWDGKEGTITAIDPDVLTNFSKVEMDFFVTATEGELPKPPVLAYDYEWYPNNTMGVAGYSLRDMGITDKWYNVVPVDLTQDGIYKIPMVASNMFIIGNAIVTVSGDNVTVDYETQWASPGNLTISSECVKWFDEAADVTADFCADPQSDLAFGEAVSKAELGNVGYLFICNRVTYCQPIADNGIYLPRYSHVGNVWADYRANLDAMVAELGD